LALAGQYAAMCRLINSQGITVVCATISMFQEVRDWNREHLTRYCEVYVKVPLDELIRRDQKGLYSRALRGEAENVMGVNASFEEPLQPDIVVENDGSRSVEAVFEELWKSIQRGAENEDELGLHGTGRGVPAEAAVL
jgi:adenylylsulfate kinase-like enzyme